MQKKSSYKKIINNKKLELSERFEAQLKLNKLPKNSAKIKLEIDVKFQEDLTGFTEN